MDQILLEIRQPKPIKTLVEISPVKEGKKISSNKNEISKLSEIRGEDIIGLGWIFLDPLEEEW